MTLEISVLLMIPKLLKDSQTYALWGCASSRETSVGMLRPKGANKEALLQRGEIQANQEEEIGHSILK